MERWAEQTLAGWGRYPTSSCLATRAERPKDLASALKDRGDSSMLAYGHGRSYGDAALISNGKAVLTRRLNRLLEFDPVTGWVRCEAGVSIKELNEIFVGRGYFPPVVPGTQYVTLGGALANDIHGKNHHVDGSFSDHVRNVDILTATGEIVRCDAETEPDLFWATVGGLGLTGIILALDLKLCPIESALIEMESIRVENLDHFFSVNSESSHYTHTVSWIDSVTKGSAMGRGIYMRGRHAPAGTKEQVGLLGKLANKLSPFMKVPINGPNWLMNGATMRAFNVAYFRKHPKGKRAANVHYEPFFFPLDFVQNWNRIYGKRGMLQYQLVVPHEPENRAVKAVLKTVTDAGLASFLSVIKEFGNAVHGGLSFPAPGITLALDFPNTGSGLLEMMDRLDAIVAEAGGRVYLGKDARISKAQFRVMYPNWEAWKAVRDRWDPNHVFQSELGRRLGLVGEAQ
ncbi:MAG: FAD-binding oxidoreductase [Myxococcota bacterium]|nr:FAD-binding oxidoreductase [Myxococcota bacterium]